MTLADKTATELKKLISEKKVSAVEVHDAFATQIQTLDGKVKAWKEVDFDYTRKEAKALDEKMASGEAVESLHGIPIGIKDIFNVNHFHCEMGSKIWKGFKPGNDARVVFDLRRHGAQILGKTQTSEFAVHEPTETCNPRDLKRAPGTSSGGSAAAVAAGMVPVAIGSQTAGSTIRPASYCGVYGFKPTFGVVPRTGVLKTTDTLDTVGWFGRSLEDIELIFETIRMKGLNYPFVHQKMNSVLRSTKQKIGIFKGAHWKYAAPQAQEQFNALVHQLEGNSDFEMINVELSEFSEIYESHELIYCKALAYYFKGEARNRGAEISRVLSEMLKRGEEITVEQYQIEINRQAQLTRAIELNFPVDLWMTLSAGGEAPIGLQSPDLPDSCKIWTYLGMPSLSLPLMKTKNGLPLGLQIVGKKYHDYQVLDLARQMAMQFNLSCPIASLE